MARRDTVATFNVTKDTKEKIRGLAEEHGVSMADILALLVHEEVAHARLGPIIAEMTDVREEAVKVVTKRKVIKRFKQL